MKVFKTIIVVLLVCCICTAVACGIVLYNQNRDIQTVENDEIKLYDENGIFQEDVFVCELEKDKHNGVKLIDNNKTDYRIVYAQTDDGHILNAVTELALYFKLLANEVEIVTDDVAPIENEIVIGKTNRDIGKTYTFKQKGGYAVRTVGKKVFIYGENTYAITNGVYGFMEDYLGCMFFDEDNTYYPPIKKLVIAETDSVNEPTFETRDVGFSIVWGSSIFTDKMRARTDEGYNSDGCHHSLYRVPAEELANHPEYYALIGGERRTSDYNTQGPQLCFSNPDVIDWLEADIVASAQSYNGDRVIWWDISQQDSMNYCHCDNCMAIAERLGGNPAGAIYECVNTIAKRHPEITISTLAYHYGSTPPINIEFEDNILIKWCIMSSYGRNDYSKSLEESKSAIGKQQYSEIVGWSKLVDHIFVWDYITDFSDYYLPFPCLTAMGDNIRLLRDCGVTGVLSLGSHNSGGYADRLKANLAAHLLWNPEFDDQQYISKFVTLYYGTESAPYILKMYKQMQDTVSSPLCCYDFALQHNRDFMSVANVDIYMDCIENAYKLAEGNEAHQARIRYDKFSILLIKLELGYYNSDAEKKAIQTEFKAIADEFGISRLSEVGTATVDDWID